MPFIYTDPNTDVPPGVDFLDDAQTDAWVLACEIDKPWRVPVRERFVELATELPAGARVLEVGSGPGLLAEAILDRCQDIESYTLLDFSPRMLELSRERLFRFPKASFVEGDFKSRNWSAVLSGKFTAILAMQSVHEVRHKRHVPGLYREFAELLVPGGILAVCDGKPRLPLSLAHSCLYMTPEEQLAAFASAGFPDTRVVLEFGTHVLVTGRAES